ncbi:MAG: hypothetical protein DRH08_01010 [Deltaproteobacteria bacterium]|nr:MAG: hypothetical protein DRH08_01010 [Deltaproteobacteria bacterium]
MSELKEALELIEEMKKTAKSMTRDFNALKSNQESLMDDAKSHKRRLDEYKEEVEKDRLEKAKEDGDVDSLLKAEQEKTVKLSQEVSDLKTDAEVKDKKANADLVKLKANEMAARNADGHNVSLLSDVIGRSLQAKDGVVTVLDAGGKETTTTLEDFEKEIQADERYGSILRGNQSSGAGGNGGNGGAVVKKFNEMNGSERKALRDKDPTEYDRLKSQ